MTYNTLCGGGISEFDDLFTEMSAERMEQARRMLEKFAENNQVIFITCDDKYTNLLTGNVIQMKS